MPGRVKYAVADHVIEARFFARACNYTINPMRESSGPRAYAAQRKAAYSHPSQSPPGTGSLRPFLSASSARRHELSRTSTRHGKWPAPVGRAVIVQLDHAVEHALLRPAPLAVAVVARSRHKLIHAVVIPICGKRFQVHFSACAPMAAARVAVAQSASRACFMMTAPIAVWMASFYHFNCSVGNLV